jgi:ureidoacrylate peracid hydrolase
MKASLRTKPEEILVDWDSSAVIVVDMQNAFVTKGGMFDLAGFDISGTSRVAEVIQRVLEAAREAKIAIFYLQMGYKADLSNSGGPDSPNWHKETGLRLMNLHQEWKGKFLTEGTWDYQIVDDLKPQSGDVVVGKSRYSGFAGTTLDSQLRTRGIRHLFFTGIATNVCVESTLRDAFFHDYWPILFSDATLQAGPPTLQQATLQNVERFLGWTVTAEEFIQNIRQHRKG